MGKIAFLFPGQGSQEVGMGRSLYDEKKEAKYIFQKADETLGIDLSEIIFNGPEEKLKLTENTQPALLTTSVAVLEVFKQYGITADFTAGHSLGEYSALVAAGALTFEDAVYAVRKRGLYMEKAVPAGEGAMAAVLGMAQHLLQEITEDISASGEPVQLANLNCPGQIVISGSVKGVERAGEQAKEHGAKRVKPLSVSGPFHSQLMKPAADQFENVLNKIDIQDAKTPVIANVTASEMDKASDIHDHLLAQLYSPVRWEETVEILLESGVDTFLEIGSGKVLSGLVKKVHRRAKTYPLNDLAGIEKAISKLRGDS